METRALLLTDVVDSTLIGEALGESAMASVWEQHDRVARDLLVDHDGLEIDRTDGFLLLFEEASRALDYAVAYHAALAGLATPLGARAGLHFGEVALRHNSPADVARGAKPTEVEGIAKPTAARIASLATAGQTLLSAAAVEALGPTKLRVVSHGHWRMKGLSEPVELFEAGDSRAPFTPPPDGEKVHRVVLRGELWQPAADLPHSLPREQNAFVGRRTDLQELARRLEGGAPVVSVLGIGGTGKTRLVTHFGWKWRGDYPGGAWFCDLSEARSLEGICAGVAGALGVALDSLDPVQQLGLAIAGRGRTLVLLDNFEQVARHAVDTIGCWLELAREAQFIVTTREILGLPGEEVLALAPLDQEAAGALFEVRASSLKRGFAPTEDERRDIAALVKLLDFLPLAIELAAARVRIMPPRVLLERMGQRFQLLSSSGARQDRQATLRATLQWSWDLLSDPEKAALAQLSVFEGGFSLEAVEAVVDLQTFDDAPFCLDLLQSLVDKSLVRVVGEARFDLLVSVQMYAAEQLVAEGSHPGSGPAAKVEAERRHGAWFAAFGADGVADLRGPDGVARRRERREDLDNLVAACRRAIARRDVGQAAATHRLVNVLLAQSGPWALALELAEALGGLEGLPPADEARVRTAQGQLLHSMGRLETGLELLDQAKALLPLLPADRELHADVLAGRARALTGLGRFAASRAEAEEAVRHADADGDPATACRARAALHVALRFAGCFEESLPVAERMVADGAGLSADLRCTELNSLGMSYRDLGRIDEASAMYSEALVLARAAGHTQAEALIEFNIASYFMACGRNEEAVQHADASRELARGMGHMSQVIDTDHMRVGLLIQLGRTEEAARLSQEVVEATRRFDSPLRAARMLGFLGMHEVQQGRVDIGRPWAEESLELALALGDSSSEAWARLALGLCCLLDRDAAGAREHAEAGLALSLRGDLRSAMACLLARVEVACGDREAAEAALAEAERWMALAGEAESGRLGVAIAETRASMEA